MGRVGLSGSKIGLGWPPGIKNGFGFVRIYFKSKVNSRFKKDFLTFFQGLWPYSRLHRAYLSSIRYKWCYAYSFCQTFIPDSRVPKQLNFYYLSILTENASALTELAHCIFNHFPLSLKEKKREEVIYSQTWHLFLLKLNYMY